VNVQAWFKHMLGYLFANLYSFKNAVTDSGLIRKAAVSELSHRAIFDYFVDLV